MIDYTITDTDSSADASSYSYLSIAEIKTYLNVDASTDDTLLGDLRDAASEYVERQFKQSLKGNKVTLLIDQNEPCKDLMFRPFDSIESVTYYNSDNSSGSLYEASSDFVVYGLAGSRTRSTTLVFNRNYNRLKIVFNSNGSTVPTDIKYATLAYIKVMYDDNRQFIGEGIPTIPPTETIQLMSPYKPVVI